MRTILDEIAVRLTPADPQSARGLALHTMAVGTAPCPIDPAFADEVLEQGIQNALVFLR